MRELHEKECGKCHQWYTPTGSAQKFCVSCKKYRRKEVMRHVMKMYRLRNGHIVGVGSGGTNATGPEDSQFKTGIRYFRRRRKQILIERRKCERCGRELLNMPRKWAVHHRDRNRAHNTDDNFELLCKRCHQLEHNCQNNLPKV